MPGEKRRKTIMSRRLYAGPIGMDAPSRVAVFERRSTRQARPPAGFPVPRRSAPRHLADLKNALLYLVLRIFRAVQILSNRICQTTVKIRSANWAARVRHFCQRTPPIGPQHPVRWIQFGRRSGPCSRLERMRSSSKTENPAAVDDSVGVRRPSRSAVHLTVVLWQLRERVENSGECLAANGRLIPFLAS